LTWRDPQAAFLPLHVVLKRFKHRTRELARSAP
jgi:hypothetical protein